MPENPGYCQTSTLFRWHRQAGGVLSPSRWPFNGKPDDLQWQEM